MINKHVCAKLFKKVCHSLLFIRFNLQGSQQNGMTTTPITTVLQEIAFPATPQKHEDKRNLILADMQHAHLRETVIALGLYAVQTLGNAGLKCFIRDNTTEKVAEVLADDIVDKLEDMLLGNWAPPNPTDPKIKADVCC